MDTGGCPSTYPNTSQQSTFRQPKPNSNRTNSIVRCLILILLLTFIGISATSIITWLILHPRVPIIRVNSLSVSNFTLSPSQLNSNYKIELNVKNPNRKIDLCFTHFAIFVLYKEKELARTQVQPFSVRNMSQTGDSVELGTNSSYVLDKRMACDVGKDWRSKRVVSFNVRMIVRAKFGGDWLSRQRSMQVFCENLKVGFFSANGTGKLMSGVNNDCLVRII